MSSKLCKLNNLISKIYSILFMEEQTSGPFLILLCEVGEPVLFFETQTTTKPVIAQHEVPLANHNTA